MKILALIASPHKNGNTDILISKMLRNIPHHKIYLDDLQLIPCKACFKCNKNGKCIMNDKFNSVIQKIKNSSILIFGSPVYCETVTAQAKILIDRTDASQTIVKLINGKTIIRRRPEWNKYRRKGIIVCTSDLSPMKEIEQATNVIKRFFGDLNIELMDEFLARELHKSGDVLNYPKLLQQTLKISIKLASYK